MRLHFLGTRGGITARSSEHYFHSSLLVSFRRTSVLIDYGEDWKTKKPPSSLSGILITHAHPDHSGGLTESINIPIYATQDTYDIYNKPLKQAYCIQSRKPFTIGSLTIEAVAVYHSLNAPAVGYRITGGKRTVFYVPDIVQLRYPRATLKGVDLYIGDGAIIQRTLLKRTKQGVPTGHCPISEQLVWCARSHIPRAIFTHCGTEIVTGDPTSVSDLVALMGKQRGIRAQVAYDGMKLTL